MEHYQNTLGIVIKKRTIKESDLMVTILTPHLGKKSVLAKGAKNIRSTRLGSLQLGNIIKAHIYVKNDSLWLSESTCLHQFLQTPKNLVQLNLLFYILEILNYFIADNQQIDGIYEVSEKIINAINDNQLNLFIKYEMVFIEMLGFGLPSEITSAYHDKDYISCQKYIKTHLESILEKPLKSNALFK